MNNKILWLDTETTGLSSKKHGLREIAYIAIVDGEVVEKDVLFINPFSYKKDVVVDSKALEISGKTIEELQDLDYIPSPFQFEVFIDMLNKYINKDDENDFFTLGGYNINFDIGFMKDWFYDNNSKDFYKYCHYKALDVFPLVLILKQNGLINTENDRLETICNYFNIEIDAHEALSDIEATKELYEKLTDSFIKKVPTLRDIEFAIKDHFIKKGYKLGVGGWGFNSKYKDKEFLVWFSENSESAPYCYYKNSNENIDQLLIDTYNYFKAA